MKKILVTGGAGFLGFEICRQLVHDPEFSGAQIFSVSRKKYCQKLQQINVLHLSLDLGDATQAEFDQVLREIAPDVIIHTAAKAGVWGPWREYFQANVVATERLLQWSIQHGVKKFIYTSSPSVIYGTGNASMEHVDESRPYPRKHLCYYAHTKAWAEEKVLASHRESGLQTVAIRPHLIWGPHDPHLLPRLVKLAQQGKLHQVGKGMNLVDVIHVQNAASAHLLALKKMQESATWGGQAFFVGQERPVPLWWFIQRLLDRYQLKISSTKISVTAAYWIGLICEGIYFFLPRHMDPPMTRFVALQLGTSHYFSQAAALKELSYRPQLTIEEGLQTLL